jgi:2-keto-3-deoxy-6-phosphogluconate aldolase
MCKSAEQRPRTVAQSYLLVRRGLEAVEFGVQAPPVHEFVRAAIARVTEVLPAAGSALDRRVRTGVYCADEPAPDDDRSWTLSS